MISREIIKQIILDQRSRRIESLVIREALPRIQPWLYNPQIISVTGLRRCGKSTLMKQIRELLKEVDFWKMLFSLNSNAGISVKYITIKATTNVIS